ncbi:efflux RND transporter permease subunit [Alteromonas sediminis]|uniref:Efflux RND transporter permease subunit n=1 Tax=Alteromonas sediminis TaxID=2259342 RepID=A0A3N5Z4C4_9ALTE|nr:efflux RND transporter permease subunit [Alteromonas sediminis]RPJ64854.1 efflux RND transporter permease subunit [Alteromonas sediminis]
MNLTKLAIDNNRITVALFIAIIVFGYLSFTTMPRAYDPGFIIRTAQVITHLPGASPERIEELVSSQIEDKVKDIAELDFVTSESRTGISIVNVNIKESYKEMRPIWDDLRRKIEDVQGDLPDGVIGPFVNDEFGDVYGIVLTMTGEGFSFAELEDIADEIKSDLLRLPEASKVEIFGEQEQRVFVEYNNARLAELGISPNQLANILQSRNIVISGGEFTLGQERIALEPSGNFENLEDIGKTIIQINGHSLYLRDIAKVTYGYVDPIESIVHSSGTPALAFAVSMRDGGNNILLGAQVSEALVEFTRTYPYGIEFDVVNFIPKEVDNKVKDFVISLVQAVSIVTAVMLLTLGIRTGLVVSALIPTAILFSLIVMQFFHIGLDQISLAALIIALGMLVDNGIVMSENILVRMEKGEDALAAALGSANEMKIPLLVASLTTSAAFLPIYLAESAVGEFTSALFTVVTITLLCSWILSMTLIPLFCITFLKVKKEANTPLNSSLYNKYGHVLTTFIRHKYLVILATIAMFIGVMNLSQFLPNLFFPPSDRPYFKAIIELPSGTSIDKTQGIVSDLEAYIEDELTKEARQDDGVTNWVSYIGNAGPRFLLSHNPKPNNSNYAAMIINVSDYQVIGELMTSLRRYTFEMHPDVDLKLRLIENGPAVENPVEVRLMSKDKALLFNQVGELKTKMLDIGQLQNISDNWGQRIKKLDIRIDQARALRAGVTSQDIAISLQASLSGMELTEFRQDEDIIPVVLRSNVATEREISKLESLSVYAQSSGKSVPLRQVADINIVWDDAKILRRDGLKTVAVGAQLMGSVTAAEKFDQLMPWLEDMVVQTEGLVRFELGGESESSGDANQSIRDKLGIAGLIILVLLVGQFNSFRKAGIVLATIPLGLIGVILGLLVGQSYFGFMTFLGIVSLAGIVINNAIVLLERIELEIEQGAEHCDAIVHAAKQRARPILLTTATTVLGMLPLYLGGGAMWEPMAIAIMAGLLFSTVMTLLVIPAMYAIFYRVTAPS